MRRCTTTCLLALLATAASAQHDPATGEVAVETRIHDEVAAPISAVLPGWKVGDDPGPGSIETWDSQDARRLRLTLNYAPVGSTAAAVLDRLRDSFRFVPGTVLADDPLARRIASGRFAEAVVLVQMPDDSFTLYVERVVALGDAYAPPILMATFSSTKGQSLDAFKASVAGRIRGIDRALDTFLMLGLKQYIAWDGEAKVSLRPGARGIAFAAPAKWQRVADPAAVAHWETEKASAIVRARLGAETDVRVFAQRFLREPCRDGEQDNLPLVQADRSDDKRAQYCFVEQAADGVPGRWHWVQVRGNAPLFLVYDVAVEVTPGTGPAEAAAPYEAPVTAAFAATAITASDAKPSATSPKK